ncbi:hypothetical protein K7X08_003363 [Anisodus acutangulus]|uniref:Sm domain-containing protein n=1 Tax=Anisodus acutangulus TaxID=402998 RepID=A0A9Q1RJC9_9SOLA|nr:hypothetical protein K7X08_003363 [Anisodus acutangulus]
MLFFSYFKDMVGREVTVELKNDLAIRGTLHSVDQYLNIKLENTRVVDEDKYPHMRSVRNCFIRGSVVRYVELPPDGVDIDLLHDATRREARGVLEVSYDPTTKLATIRGKFDPMMIIEAIKEKGKKAEHISYSKNPLYDQAHNSTSRNSNHHHFEKTDQNAHNKEDAAAYSKDKGKAKVGDDTKRNEHWWNSSDDESSDDHNHIHESEDYVSAKNKKCEDFVSTKNKKKYHKAEAYVAPQGVDESICRDHYCKIHRRGGGIRDYVTQEERKKKYAMFMQMGAQYPAGFFNGLGQAS